MVDTHTHGVHADGVMPEFDPYYRWLGIPPEDQPPHYYRLLGIEVFESDADVIDTAADRIASDLKRRQSGERGDLSEKLFSEVSVARVCLLNPQTKAEYDAGLREQIGLATAGEPGRAPRATPKPTPVSTDIPVGRRDGHGTSGSATADPVDRPEESFVGRLRAVKPATVAIWAAAGVIVLGLVLVLSRNADPPSNEEVGRANPEVADPATDPEPVAPSADVRPPDENGDAGETDHPPAAGEAPAAISPPPTEAEPAGTDPPAEVNPPDDATAQPPVPTDPPAGPPTDPGPQPQPPLATDGEPDLPSEEELEEARRLVREVFGKDHETAKTAVEKAALANAMLAVVSKPDTERASKYVLLQAAHNVAAGAGDMVTVFRVIDELERCFAVDGRELRAKSLVQTSRAALLPIHRKAIGEHALPIIAEAMAADDYEIAHRVAQAAIAAVQSTGDADLSRKLLLLSRQAEAAETEFSSVKQALATLQENPDDADANLVVGHFYCFIKGDWAAGLPVLALGSDTRLAELARRELSRPGDPDSRIALAEAWWELAESTDPRYQQPARARARTWYARALPDLPPGLTRNLAENRADGATAGVQADDTPGSPALALLPTKPPPGILVIQKARFGTHNKKVDVSAKIQRLFDADPYAPIHAHVKALGDPVPYWNKHLQLTYTYAGRHYSYTVGTRKFTTIPRLQPGEGVPLPTASQKFRILAARYGGGKSFIDVTEKVTSLAKDPATPFSFSTKTFGKDPAPRVDKALAVWFDFGGRRYVRLARAGQIALIPPKP